MDFEFAYLVKVVESHGL